MAEAPEDWSDVEKLYEFTERLNDADDKSQHKADYEGIIAAVNGSVKAKQLAAQLIPKYFKDFPELADQALDQHLYLCEDEELAVRVQAIRGLPLFCKDTPEHLSKIVDILGQLLVAGENVERDAVHKALLSLLRQDVKTSLTALFKHVGSNDDQSAEDLATWESIREKVLCFIRDKVFPLRSELLKPQEEMEGHISNLVKQNIQDATATEFKMFIDLLKSLSLYGQNAPVDRIQEIVEIIESQADLDAQFNVSDSEHIDRFISCMCLALPFFMRGASSCKYFDYLNKQILPVLDKLSDETKLDLLKNLAECSLYASPQDSRQFLPSFVQLLKKYMVDSKTEEVNLAHIECLLYTFHQLAHKTPNATNSLCGYKIVTGQPSDRLGEDFAEQFKDFTQRLSTIGDLAKTKIKKLTQGMAEHNKAMAAAKTEEEKDVIKIEKQKATSELRMCNNILAMTQPLHSKSPSFIGDQKICLSWKDVTKAPVRSSGAVAGQKRSFGVAYGSSNYTSQRGDGAGGSQNQHTVFTRLNDGGRTGGRGWQGRGRGMNY